MVEIPVAQRCTPVADLHDDDDVYLTSTSQRKRYDNISAMTFWRWERDPRLNYPPAIEINGRKYRSLRALKKWELERAAHSNNPGQVRAKRALVRRTAGENSSAANPPTLHAPSDDCAGSDPPKSTKRRRKRKKSALSVDAR